MINEASLLLAGIVLTGVSGFANLLTGRRSVIGQWLAAIINVAGAGAGLVGALQSIAGARTEIARLPTPLPQANLVLAVDALSAWFLIPIFLISLLGAIYGLDYWRQSEHPDNGRRLRLFYGFLTGGLATLVLAGNSVAFLVGWEIMAVSAFFVVSTDDRDDEVRSAGWLYLAASHTATLSLFTMFALLYGLTGTYDLMPLAPGSISPTAATAVFLLGLLGFGLKAGIMPLHFWLPSAHAMAPSHVSALMSGVLIKTGIYGLVRITSILPEPPLWWGGLLLALGVVSAVLGVTFALGQHDLKRLLAYHSIENIGIIVIGLALALIGRTLSQEIWIVLGLSGSLLHVLNHALFKSLLFLSAGSVIHAQHTREIDHLGGLAKTMPWTSGAFLVGATAICGLPPLNGFVSEFLIYNGLFHTIGLEGEAAFPAGAFVIPALGLMGALAVACFVKVFGVVFLGSARTSAAHAAHESPWTMVLPMGVISLCCGGIGLGAIYLAPVLNSEVEVWLGHALSAGQTVEQVAALSQVSVASVVLFSAVAIGSFLLALRLRTRPLDWAETWGCGYAGPTPRMQYTSSSLAQILVTMFAWVLRPSVHRNDPQGLFPRNVPFETHVPEVVLDRAVLPSFHRAAKVFYAFRVMQQGSTQVYLLYIFAILVLLLLFWR